MDTVITNKIREFMTIVNNLYPNLSWDHCGSGDMILNVGAQFIPADEYDPGNMYMNGGDWKLPEEMEIFYGDQILWKSGRYSLTGFLNDGRVNINLHIDGDDDSDEDLVESIENILNLS